MTWQPFLSVVRGQAIGNTASMLAAGSVMPTSEQARTVPDAASKQASNGLASPIFALIDLASATARAICSAGVLVPPVTVIAPLVISCRPATLADVTLVSVSVLSDPELLMVIVLYQLTGRFGSPKRGYL